MIFQKKYNKWKRTWISKQLSKTYQSRLFHTHLCCFENMNKNTIIVSPNIPKMIIKNHGNWKSEKHKNNISLRIMQYLYFTFLFHIKIFNLYASSEICNFS